LQAIPAELYEVASIDGAGVWGKFRHITLPGLASVIATALLLRMIWVANSLDLILVMTGGGPGTATQTLPLHAFLTAWSGGNYGQGSALAVMLTLLLLGVVIAYVWRRQGAMTPPVSLACSAPNSPSSPSWRSPSCLALGCCCARSGRSAT